MISFPICYNGHSIDPVWNTCVRLLSPNDELPLPDTITNLYLDFETTSGDPSIKSLNPHKNCSILGVSVLFDSEPQPYYVPVRHVYLDEDGNYQVRTDYPNFSPEKVHDWLKKLLSIAKQWINQNIKYDVHVVCNEVGIFPPCKLIDTLTLAKLSELVEQLNYSLDHIMRLLGVDITPYEAALHRFLGTKLKDYALVPTDQMAIYGGVDVLSSRFVHRNIKISAECERVLELEHRLLPRIIQMEQVGLHTDFDRLTQDWREINPLQSQRISKIKQLSGYESFDPSKKNSLKKLFCEHLEWELDWTPKSYEKFSLTGNPYDLNPSFSYDSIWKHRQQNPELVDTWVDYQEDAKLLNSFVCPYLESHLDDLHLIKCSYNQIVHTGRMSCSYPNMQQLGPRAKAYVIPYTDDYVLVEFDLSQIEFRLLVHYIGNKKAIHAFCTDPTTDYHDWIATECAVDRTSAKRVNFGTGYGAGKDRIHTILLGVKQFLDSLNGESSQSKALAIYEKYHATLPELRPTRNRATAVAKSRGYVRTLFGRQRRLPDFLAHRSFASICQGSAADILKDITLRLTKFDSLDCILHLLVHDCWVFSIRKDRLSEIVPAIQEEIERPLEGVNLSVPLRSKCVICPERWSDAKKDITLEEYLHGRA